MRYHKEKKSVRIIVGGPPNSGKSTLSECIARAFQDQGIDAESVELDVFSPTLDYLKGKMTKEERDEQKHKPVTIKKIKEAVKRFSDASAEHEIVIGDAPGGISEESKLLYKKATHGIIVCKEDEINHIGKWKSFFKKMNIPIIAIVISKIDGDESVKSSQLIEAILVKLDRNIRITPSIRQLAVLLRDRCFI